MFYSIKYFNNILGNICILYLEYNSHLNFSDFFSKLLPHTFQIVYAKVILHSLIMFCFFIISVLCLIWQHRTNQNQSKQSFAIVSTQQNTLTLWHSGMWAMPSLENANEQRLHLLMKQDVHSCSVSASPVFKILRRRDKDPAGCLSASQRGAF